LVSYGDKSTLRKCFLITLDEEKWKCAGLAQEIGFGSAELHAVARKSCSTVCTCRQEVNKYDLTAGQCFRLARHNDSSRWFAISSSPPICCPGFSFKWVGLQKSKITKLGCEKYFCWVPYWLSWEGIGFNHNQANLLASYVWSPAPRIESGGEILWAAAEKFVAMLKLEHRYFCLEGRDQKLLMHDDDAHGDFHGFQSGWEVKGYGLEMRPSWVHKQKAKSVVVVLLMNVLDFYFSSGQFESTRVVVVK
jgi:hypothetical protein